MNFDFFLFRRGSGGEKGSFRGICRLWPYLLLFCAAFLVFLGLLYGRACLKSGVSRLLDMAVRGGTRVEDVNFTAFPPRLDIRRIVMPGWEKELEVSDLRLAPVFMPPGVRLECSVLGGSFEARAVPESWFRMAGFTVAFEFADVSLMRLLELAGEKRALFAATQGLVGGRGQLDVSLHAGSGIDWSKSGGRLAVAVSHGALKHKLPMLRPKELENASGELTALIAGGKCVIERCVLRSGDIALNLQGRFSPWFKPAGALLDLNFALQIPARLLEENLMPGRTMARLKRHGLVRARIGGTMRNPVVRLED